MEVFSKMAEINDTVKQLGERTEYLPQYTLTTTSFIGPESVLSGVVTTNKKGDKYNSIANTVIESSVTEKMEADRLRWNVSYKTWLSGGGGGGSDPYISQTWSMNMTQYEFPLDRYLDPDNSRKYNAWKNTDEEHKRNFQYLELVSPGAGPQYDDLSGMALSCAKKFYAGIESVMKFYPQATRTSVYDRLHEFKTRADALNHIDNSSVSAEFSLSCSWLKSGFDWTQNNDNTWVLTESWIGIPADNPWDSELYGPNQWKFYIPTDA